ncbi:MAG TPA: hypothetical protein ENI23_13965 [bacterium]|nr:hypothetical protein [bacterium]
MKVSLKNAYYTDTDAMKNPTNARLLWFFDNDKSKAFQIPVALIDKFIQQMFEDLYIKKQKLNRPKKLTKPGTMKEVTRKLI